MRFVASFFLLSIAVSSIARADDAKRVERAEPKLGITFKHPDGAKVVVKGSTITISGPTLSTVTIAIKATDERSVAKNGGVSDKHVEWTIDAPKRAARCTADGGTDDQAASASAVCESIELAPGPRRPHVELIVTSDGLADGAAFEARARAKKKALDACWKAALAKDADLPEGSMSLDRTYEHGAPAHTTQNAENFFDHDPKPLGACVFPLLKAVPAKAADAATTKVEVIFQLY